MKKLLLSTVLVTATAGFALAQEATTPPETTGGETPPAATETVPTSPVAPDATTNPDLGTSPLETNTGTTATGDSREGFSPVLTEAVTSDTLEGAAVYSSEDEHIGDISELVLDPAGTVTEVIVDVGGFLGIGAKSVALTLTDLELLQENEGDEIRAYAPMTREQLEALPEHQS